MLEIEATCPLNLVSLSLQQKCFVLGLSERQLCVFFFVFVFSACRKGGRGVVGGGVISFSRLLHRLYEKIHWGRGHCCGEFWKVKIKRSQEIGLCVQVLKRMRHSRKEHEKLQGVGIARCRLLRQRSRSPIKVQNSPCDSVRNFSLEAALLKDQEDPGQSLFSVKEDN